LTAGDLASLPEELDGQAVKYELFDGQLIVLPPNTAEHARRQARMSGALQQAESLGLGDAYASVGIVLRRNPDRVVGADAAFILAQSLPAKYSREGYLLTIPEIIVEVESKNDTDAELHSKCQEYFEAGAKVVWRIDPQTKTVLVAHSDGRERTLGLADTLRDEDLLPGFAVSVAILFK
jgi:Uma2 family endonuclease